ncbi:MAG: M3 family metallopeptidase [Pseudomonadota bacterium]
MTHNPLLSDFQRPPFLAIKTEHMFPAIEAVISENKAAIGQLVEDETPPTWENLVAQLDELDNRLSRAWGPISHLNNVMNSDALREAYDQCLPILSDYSTFVSQHQALFQRYQALANSEGFNKLDDAQRKVLEDNLRDFRLAGVDLADDKKKRYGEIRRKLSEVSSKFEQNLLDATMAWHQQFDDAKALEGLPDLALQSAQQTAHQKKLSGYVITLEYPSYSAVITYANDRQLRETVYTAFSTRASDQGPHAGQYDNSQLIDELLRLKQDLAQLLNFNTYADYSLETKMANSPQEVVSFLEDLADKSLQQAKNEVKELADFARKKDGLDKLAPWDVAYYSEKLKQERYQISQEELRVYFPVNRVLKGLFAITSTLFDVSFRQRDDVELWHKDAEFFDVVNGDGEVIGGVYLDLYARPHKRGGAWMDDLQGRHQKSNGHLQKPIACLVCNFIAPIGDAPALLTHDEVVTLFHEFGHGLHHLLTKVNYLQASGINGVPWDAVELPSQFFENFCWQETSLSLIAGHKDTGESLPKEKLQKLLDAKNFQSAMAMVRQIEFGLFDIKLHNYQEVYQDNTVQSLLNQVREQVAVLIPPSFNRFQHGFSHIFGGGYAAGYYSYKWAEVLSADAFSRFEKEGILEPTVGLSFKQTILEKGGSEEPLALFKAFMGREPQVDALLKHSGIHAA